MTSRLDLLMDDLIAVLRTHRIESEEVNDDLYALLDDLLPFLDKEPADAP